MPALRKSSSQTITKDSKEYKKQVELWADKNVTIREIHKILTEDPNGVRKGADPFYVVLCKDGKFRNFDEAYLVRKLLTHYKQRGK